MCIFYAFCLLKLLPCSPVPQKQMGGYVPPTQLPPGFWHQPSVPLFAVSCVRLPGCQGNARMCHLWCFSTPSPFLRKESTCYSDPQKEILSEIILQVLSLIHI